MNVLSSTALSGLNSAQTRLAAAANNIANMNTPGFRRDEVSAVEFLHFVQLVQQHWVLNGEVAHSRSPGLHHNVSNTCTVKTEEWNAVADFIWKYREHFTGVALLGHDGDKRYPQAPREAVTTADDFAKWNRLRYVPVNSTELAENSDETKLKEVVACAGGACELT